MGKILRTKKLTTLFEGIIVVVGLIVVGAALYFYAPGLRVGDNKNLESMNLDSTSIDNQMNADLLPLPTTIPSLDASKKPLVRIAGYAWNGETPIITANGGPRTTKGSLMEASGVNLEIVRQDWLSGLREMQMKFIEEYNAGEAFPNSDKAAFAVMIMGDGAPFYISTMQSSLDQKFGKDKYHVQVIGCMGMSYGEDKLIGPAEWKNDPQTMKGALISTVPGDGDWVVALNYAFANNLPVNPDFDTYDPNAVNFCPAPNDDYMMAAKDLIKSQKNGYTISLKEVKNGELTGNTINKKIDGCATWTPGDKEVFDALTGFTDIVSTREFNNQMATTIIAFTEWSEKNPEIVTNILKSTLTASNQIKEYDQWQKAGADAVAKTFNLENGQYWYSMFKGQKGSKNGLDYRMGGTKALNYADVMQYYGLSDGTDRYKSVYNQVSTYLVELNPFDFNSAVSRVVPYEEAMNLSFLKNITDITTGTADKVSYSEEKTNVMATGEWHINFSTGSAIIQVNSTKDIETVYNLLIQAEDTKIKIIGHTDNTGDPTKNLILSKDRANSVAESLLSKGISIDRIQSIDGKGDTQPIGDNNTSSGRAENRRVEIIILN